MTFLCLVGCKTITQSVNKVREVNLHLMLLIVTPPGQNGRGQHVSMSLVVSVLCVGLEVPVTFGLAHHWPLFHLYLYTYEFGCFKIRKNDMEMV